MNETDLEAVGGLLPPEPGPYGVFISNGLADGFHRSVAGQRAEEAVLVAQEGQMCIRHCGSQDPELAEGRPAEVEEERSRYNLAARTAHILGAEERRRYDRGTECSWHHLP